MRRIEQPAFRQSRDGTAALIGGHNGFAEFTLVQALLYRPQGIAALDDSLWNRSNIDIGCRESKLHLQCLRIPADNENREHGLIDGRTHAEKIDDRQSAPHRDRKSTRLNSSH